MPSRFHGTWRLIAFESHSADGAITLPFGDQPKGMLVYTPQGHMSGQAMRSDHDPQAAGPLDNYIAYFGTFTVDDAAREVVHHVEGSLYPNWVGTEQRRGFTFSGNRLTLTAAMKRTSSTLRLIWERA
ncbi:MAG: lipocalin-like domain-containing protein [Bryobacteraceae bacterium]